MDDVEHALTILAVRELPAARAFYSALLGWPATVETPVYAELRHERGMRLGLYQREGFARNVGQTPIEARGDELHAAELYFYAGAPEEAVARAIATGGRVLSALAPRDWGETVAYLADPDGHVIALARR